MLSTIRILSNTNARRACFATSVRATIPNLMIRKTSLFLLAVLSFAGCTSSASSVRSDFRSTKASVEYTVSIPDPTSERFHVEAVVRGISDDTLTFLFPVWAPGAYDVVDFGKYVRNFKAMALSEDPGHASETVPGDLSVIRPDSNTFRIVGDRHAVYLSYDVQDIEYVSNSAWFGLSDVEPDMAFANATALFGYPAGYKNIPYTVTYIAPRGWDVAVGLDPAGEARPNTYVAHDYDELADSPVQMGSFQRFTFDVNGIPHMITVSAPARIEDTTGAELVGVTRTIVNAMSGLFGDMPYKRYLFHHFLVTPRSARGGFGALEHANSSVYRMPFYGQETVPATLAAVVAHEYWHVWSPKRIHVRELGPFDYQRAPSTTSLWFAEGVTEYYARAILSRIGFSRAQSFLSEAQHDMSGLYRREQFEPMTDLSLRVAHAPMSEVVDLYKKGPLIAMLMDIEIRWQTANKRSLDDAMRYFNDNYARKGVEFGDDDIIPIIERATGARLGEFFGRYIAGRETLPFDSSFAHAGLRYVVRDTIRPALGAILQPSNMGVKIEQVLEGGSAAAMGLLAGDVVNSIDFDGYQIPVNAIPLEYIDQLFADADEDANEAGAAPRYNVRAVGISRNGRPMTIPAVVRVSPSMVERLEIDPSAEGLALAIRKTMLGF